MSTINPADVAYSDNRAMLMLARQLIEQHANEDYNLSEARNKELTALTVAVVTGAFMGSNAMSKEIVVAAYLLGRADGLAAVQL